MVLVTRYKRTTGMTKETKELSRLRNRHVAKLLTHIGDVAPYLEQAIKHSYTMFADDIQANILNSDNSDNSGHTGTNTNEAIHLHS